MIGPGQRGKTPIGSSRVYWFAIANAPEGGYDGRGHKRELLSRFEGWHDPIPQVLALAHASSRNHLYS